MASFAELPLDIVLIVASYLDASSFVALTQTCRGLARQDFAHSWLFWSSAVRSTFRVPNQPVVAHDGHRWKKLYQRLLTETRPYTWGNNKYANLGHSYVTSDQLYRLPPRTVRRARQCSWPQQMDHYRNFGIIADLQAGGWSTTFLTSAGALLTTGVMNGLQTAGRLSWLHVMHQMPEPLKYPRGYIHPMHKYNAQTAIRQFSAGRAHVVGLSDAGNIWSWNNIDALGLEIKLLNVDLKERGNANGRSKVKKVVAGWNKSAALIEDVGIVLWDPVSRPENDPASDDAILILDFVTVPQTAHLKHRQRDISHGADESSIGEVLNFIVLEDFVVFNTHLGRVFASRITWTDGEHSANTPIELHPHISQGDPSQATENLLVEDDRYVTDVQGSFRSFAVFTKLGQVLNATQDMLRQNTPIAFTRIPALQNAGVISLAFGDYHFLALHKDGYITSYGTESEGCGSLGLGGHRDPEGRIRGIRYSALSGDGKLVPHAYTTGRRVWFEPEKREWLKFLLSGGRDPQEAVERMRMTGEVLVNAEVSEWIEQEGNAWAVKYAHPAPIPEHSEDEEDDDFHDAVEDAAVAHDTVPEDADDDDILSPYFALSVTAAGWHSGALVLVNQPSADRIRENCIIRLPRPPRDPTPPSAESGSSGTAQSILGAMRANISWLIGFGPPRDDRPHRPVPTRQGADDAHLRQQQGPYHRDSSDPMNHGAAPDARSRYRWAQDAFPRLELSDGRVMPGEAELATWRFGRPDWDLDFTTYS